MTALRSQLLQDLQLRGFIHQCTDLEGLDMALATGRKIAVYAGFDCTADSLHVGNLMTLSLLRRFHAAGHTVVPVIGTTTTLIGDPSGKDEARPLLRPSQIAENAHGLAESVRRVLGDAEPAVTILHNDEWLTSVDWPTMLRRIGPHLTIPRMLGLDSVRTRLDREGGTMSFLEFNYSAMQAYDFLHLNCRHPFLVQVGGSDQWGNITMGSDLIGKVLGERIAAGESRAWGLTHPLLTTPDGRKMGKSEAGTAVWLNPAKLNDFEFWQYWRNVPDTMVTTLLRLFTDKHPADIAVIEEDVRTGAVNINAIKISLATLVTERIRGLPAALQAEKAAAAMFGGDGGVIAEGMAEFRLRDTGRAITYADHVTPSLAESVTWTEVAATAGLCTSRSDARRQIDQGGLKLNHEPLTADRVVTASDFAEGSAVLSRGKKNHVRVTLAA